MPHHTAAALTPAMQAVIERAARVKRPALWQLSAPEARASYAAGADVLNIPKAELPLVKDLQPSARDGHALPARLYSSQAVPAQQSVLLFFHGGGWTVGSISTHDILCRELARLSGVAVLSVDYRLAPEYPFPAAVQDARDAMHWLFANARSLGLNPEKIAVGGDSAGGNLAAVCAHLARDAGLPLALQLLIYPSVAGLTKEFDSGSRQAYAQGYLLEAAHTRYFFDSYLSNKIDGAEPFAPEHWLFEPFHAESHEGLAPLFMAVAECDSLYDECIAYADLLRAAGNPVQLEIYRGVVHNFIMLGKLIPEARQFHQDAAAALKVALLDAGEASARR
jgi:acetyl esterase